jgi:hypothetical protein
VKIHIDDAQLRTLEVDLAGAPGRMQQNAPNVLRTKVGPRLQTEMKRDARNHRYLPHLPSAVTWEMRGEWTVEAGLGPDGNQGSLAHIIAYGSVNNAPVYDHTAALRRVTPFALKWLADVAEDAVLGGT